jgi:hypothetical protein
MNVLHGKYGARCEMIGQEMVNELRGRESQGGKMRFL